MEDENQLNIFLTALLQIRGHSPLKFRSIVHSLLQVLNSKHDLLHVHPIKIISKLARFRQDSLLLDISLENDLLTMGFLDIMCD